MDKERTNRTDSIAKSVKILFIQALYTALHLLKLDNNPSEKFYAFAFLNYFPVILKHFI